MDIPARCRVCAHWLGHESGRADDARCNRYWGHEARYGDFYDEAAREAAYGHPAFVEDACRVALWLPLPPTDVYGNQIGPDAREGAPPLVDAFIPRASARGPFALETTSTDGAQHTYYLSTEELGAYLTMTPQQKKAWEARRAQIDAITDKHLATHKSRLGTSGKVTTADLQPPYARGLERIPTGLINLDHALGGGIIPGLTIGLWGNPSGGKSTLKHRLEAAVLDYYRAKSPFPDDERIIAIMSEGGLYDTAYAEALGVPTKNVLVPQFEYAEEAFQYIADFVSAKGDLSDFYGPETYSYEIPVPVRLVTVDSIDGLKLWEDVHGAKDKEKILADSNKVGAQAMLLSQFFRINGNMPSIPITSIFITQVRTKMGGTAAWDSGHRGKAYPHYIRCEIRVRAEKAKEGMTTQEVELEFLQAQFSSNVYPGRRIKLAMRTTGGFHAKDQCAVVGIERGLIEVKGGGNWSYQARDGRLVKGRGADPGRIADVLEAEGCVEEIYARLMNMLSGRDRDDDGVPVATEPAFGAVAEGAEIAAQAVPPCV